MDGIIRCTRYAFGPNRLHYCGPDATSEILEYINQGESDPGLESLLRRFRTMYPYLLLIAHANGISDPLDSRVVEAYWIGNSLLERIGKQGLYRHLTENLEIKKKLDPEAFRALEDAIAEGALPHHSFHVFDVWRRTGKLDEAHTLDSMDSCRISWGKVLSVHGPKITVEREPLVLDGPRLRLAGARKETITRALDCPEDITEVRPGDTITIHWGVPCETISKEQGKRLRKYTLHHIRLANLHPR